MPPEPSKIRAVKPSALAADVTVYAAASLKEALDEQARNFETAKAFWEPLGFVATDEAETPYVHLPFTSDHLDIAFHRPRT